MFEEEFVDVGDGITLATRSLDSVGPARLTFLLVHGLASNAQLWDGVAEQLAVAGYRSVAVDARGHGRSPDATSGYDTETAAADLARVLRVLDSGLDTPRPVVAAGQSWGGNVVLTLAARHPGSVDGIALLDGGWIRLGHRFATFDECWQVLAPPVIPAGVTFDGIRAGLRAGHPDWPEDGIAATLANLRVDDSGRVVNRLAREHHRSILESLYRADPRQLYPEVTVPSLLMPAGGPASPIASAVDEAVGGLPDARVLRYDDADHDLHAQFPHRVAADLSGFAADLVTRATGVA